MALEGCLWLQGKPGVVRNVRCELGKATGADGDTAAVEETGRRDRRRKEEERCGCRLI